MKWLFFLFVALILLPVALADTLSYSITLSHEPDGRLILKDLSLVNVAASKQSAGEGFALRVISFKGEILYNTTFNAAPIRFYGLPISKATAAQPMQSSQASLVDLVVPYYRNAKSIVILKGESVVLSIDASRFSVCNENAACDGSETADTCPGDCTCGNGACDANENHVTCSADCERPKESGNSKFIYFGLIGAALAVAGFIFLSAKGRKKK